MRPEIRLVVLDLDGTLVDSMGRLADKASELMAAAYPVDRDRARLLYLETSGYPFRVQLERLFPRNTSNELIADRFEAWKAHVLETLAPIDPFPGAREVIQDLRAIGRRVAISSSNTQVNVDHHVDHWQLEIDAALGLRDGGFGKGEAHFAFLERTLGHPRSAMLYVGDSLNDCRIARQAGVRFLGVLTTFPREEFSRVDRHVECVSDVGRLGAWMRSASRV